MSQLSDSVKFMEDYVKQTSTDLSNTISSLKLSDKENPSGTTQTTVEDKTLTNIKTALAGSPIVQAGVDTINQMGTTIAQGLVKSAFQKANFSPMQNAVQNFFQSWATISTFDTEIAMELARNTARNITTLIDKKQALSNDINLKLTELHNACIIILNSTPFLDAYIQKLITAYGYLGQADTDFDVVISALKSETNPIFQKQRFNAGVSLLDQAQLLILPDRSFTSDNFNIIGSAQLASNTIGRKTNAQALAAAVAISGMTLQIGQKVIEYVAAVVEINLLLNTYVDAMDGYITSFTKNNNIYKVTADHVSSGSTQLKTLMTDMNSSLNPNPTTNPDFSTTQINYGPRLSASATSWGVRLQGIIEWMKMNPGVGAASIDQTSNSVLAYTKSIDQISKMGNISYIGGTYLCSNGREGASVIVGKMASLLLKVNTIVSSSKTKYQITDEFRFVKNYFDASTMNSNRLKASLGSFISSASTLPTGARENLNKMLGLANQYGLDRVVGLINDGKVRELFSVTPDTATYSGTAVMSMNDLINVIRTSSVATDFQVQKLESLRDEYSRMKKAKDIEANRSYGSTLNAAQEEIQTKVDQTNQTVSPALEAAKEIDPAASSDNDLANKTMANTIAGFNANKAAAGLQ